MQFGDYVLDFLAALWLAVGFFAWQIGGIVDSSYTAAENPIATFLIYPILFIAMFILPSAAWFGHSAYTNKGLTAQRFFPTRFLIALAWVVLLLWLVSQLLV